MYLSEKTTHCQIVTGPVQTGCAGVDELLGGGFERGAVTQVYGPPAAGKTNVVLSGAVETAARGDTALLIDTEGLSIDRLEQLAAAHPDATVDDVASNIIITEVYDFEDQREAVQDVSEFASQVEFVAVDSATGFYRLERTEQEQGEALRDVTRQVTHLLSLARKHDIAVAITNQVYTDPETDKSSALGGHTLNHWSAIILRLDRFRGGNRRATLEKHHSKSAGETAQFRITEDGLEKGDP
ncbi:DNA repair protein RadB [Halovenus aranensis]|uniref:DNA repair and recombination protein RadB n=1 Tax=Halovenus aranensis TaxID=890420 RepID=A0A1G8W8F0_9EURY|nr:DNA repair protein RadB [Halovenus aranensis]